MRLLNDTRFVIPFLLLLIVIFSFFLYRNVTDRTGGSNSPTIGVLTFKTKTVLRKFNDQVVWDNLETSSEVKNRDTIRTEGLSDAMLTLNDGTKINISENSMILLDISDQNININFAYGSFEAARDGSGSGNSKMKITAGDKTVEVGKGDVKLDKTKDELNVKVENGEAKISANGKEETVSKDQVANISSDGLRVSKPKFGLINPPGQKNLFSESGNESVGFSISGVTPYSIRNSSPIIEVSLIPDFSKTIIKERLKTASISRTLAIGSYYWRVSYVDSKTKVKQSTEISRFRLLSNPAIRLFLPKEGENFAYTSETPVVKVAWGILELYGSYTVQIARDATFFSDVKSKQTQNQAIAFDDLGDGTFYARVIATSNIPEVKEKMSPVIKFSIGKRLKFEAPVLLEPSKGKTFIKEQIKPGIFFSWKDNKEFESFSFEISSESNFSKIETKQNSQTNFIKIGGDMQEGKYFWRVKGVTSGKEDTISNINSFSIQSKEDLNLISPVNQSEVELSDKGTILLKWKKLNTKSEYLLEISKFSDFSILLQKEKVSISYFENKPQEFGKFYWRITADTNNGSIVSDTWNFNITSSMEAPHLVSPSKNESIDISKRNNIQFNWKLAEKASAYRIRMFNVSGIKEKQIFSEKTTHLKYFFSDFVKLSEGRYRWEVCSLYTTKEREKESVYTRSDIFITLPPLSAPKILTPGKVYVE